MNVDMVLIQKIGLVWGTSFAEGEGCCMVLGCCGTMSSVYRTGCRSCAVVGCGSCKMGMARKPWLGGSSCIERSGGSVVFVVLGAVGVLSPGVGGYVVVSL